jgi:hypothetical protein
MPALVRKFLLSAYKPMVSLLWIFQILVCKLQSIEIIAKYINTIKDSSLSVDLLSFCSLNFSSMTYYSYVSSGKNIIIF